MERLQRSMRGQSAILIQYVKRRNFSLWSLIHLPHRKRASRSNTAIAETSQTPRMNNRFSVLLIFAICFWSTTLLSAEPTLPKVELNNGGPGDEWKGLRLDQIVKPAQIKSIVRIHEHHLSDTFRVGVGDGDSKTRDQRIQSGYDAFCDRLFKSEQKAIDGYLDAREAQMAELIIVMQDGSIFQVEVLGDGASEVSAMIISSSGKCARIPIAAPAPSPKAK